MPPKITTKIIKDRLYKAVGDEYSVNSEYTKGTEPMEFIHNVCGKIYKVTPNKFFYDNRRCNCYGINAKSPDKYKEEFLSSDIDNEYELLSEYSRSNKNVKIRHKKCNHTYSTPAKCFIRGNRCPKCYGKNRKKTEEFKKQVYELTNGDFILLSEYHNNKTKVNIKHMTCNKIYSVTPHDFIGGNRCPYCNQSKGETIVKGILDKLNIPYEIEKKFNNLRVKGSYLPYDFSIYDNKGNIILLIEYDGIQHFKEVKYFGGAEKLKSQKRRDKLKNDYARGIGVTLLRLPYTLSQDNIEKEILKTYKHVKQGNLNQN